MKNEKISSLLFLAFIIILFSCQSPETNLIKDENPQIGDSLIYKLRSTIDFQSFDFSKVEDQEKFKALETTIKERWEKTSEKKSLIQSISWGFTGWAVRSMSLSNPEPAPNPNMYTIDDPKNFPTSSKLEKYVAVPFGSTMTGVGLRSITNDLTNAQLFYKIIDSNKSIGSTDYNKKENKSTLEEVCILSNQYTTLKWVALGFGFRAVNDYIENVRIYYAPYNPATGLIELTSINDVIHVDMYNSQFEESSSSNKIEQYIRTFDCKLPNGNPTYNLDQLRRTHIIGIGGRVQNGSGTRIAIKMATMLNN